MYRRVKDWLIPAKTPRAPRREAPARHLGADNVGSQRHLYAEMAGRGGIDATRYGDWEYGSRCTDF